MVLRPSRMLPRRRKVRTAPYARRMVKYNRVRRSLYPKANEPTFVETFRSDDSAFGGFVIPAGAGIGKTFKLRITDIPQVAQYQTLYRQYRINWIKIYVIPDVNTESSDGNASAYNQTVAAPFIGMCRVVHAIDDTPNVTPPATEQELLEENGCKIKSFRNKWTCSFKPVPDVQQTTPVGQIYTRQKYRQWFNFDTVLVGNNPLHGAVNSYWTLPGGNAASLRCSVYYKVSFTLRDPQ